MPQTSPAPAPPAQRLAARICKLTNAKGSADAEPALAEIRKRKSAGEVSAAIKVAIERGWLRRDGATYVVTPAGFDLGEPRSGTRSRRVMPF